MARQLGFNGQEGDLQRIARYSGGVLHVFSPFSMFFHVFPMTFERQVKSS
jgi:hypothetical protein